MDVRLVLTAISSLFFSISLSCAAAVKNGLLISVNLDELSVHKINLDISFAFYSPSLPEQILVRDHMRLTHFYTV